VKVDRSSLPPNPPPMRFTCTTTCHSKGRSPLPSVQRLRQRGLTPSFTFHYLPTQLTWWHTAGTRLASGDAQAAGHEALGLGGALRARVDVPADSRPFSTRS
jgi:hypothetical protein